MTEIYFLVASVFIAFLMGDVLNKLILRKVAKDRRDWETRHREEQALLTKAQKIDEVY